MTSFLALIGASASTWEEDEVFYKRYEGLSAYHWDRIKAVYQMASDRGISPVLLEVDDEDALLSWKIITPFEGTDEPPDALLISVNLTRRIIRQKVDFLHRLGYAHGDLHIGNIGVTDEQDIVFVDFDTTFLIVEDRDQQWVKDWMNEGFDEDDYDAFVEYDWNTWETDFLSDTRDDD